MRTIIGGLLVSLLVIGSSSSGANELGQLEVLPLAPDHVGLTMKESPSLCWMLKGKPPDKATMTFTLNDMEHVQPILEVPLPGSFLIEKTETCHCVNLRDYGIKLRPDTVYRWLLSMRKNPESHSQDIVAGGMIARCEVTDCLIEIVHAFFVCDMESVKYLAKSGLWYDSVSCLCDLIKANPTDPSLRRLLASLMNDGGLRKIPGGLQKLKPEYLVPLK